MLRGSGASSRQLHVTAGFVQPGKERFPSGEIPVAANGRNNLTAISTELDLYFVAELDHILVFRPCFPTQRLSKLLYKWRLYASGRNLRGYIDHQNPHAINSMLITKLGTQEVLVCACDDGDIILYYTSVLQDISIAKDFEFDADRHPNPKPFLIENVKRSAWGLAIHTNARKLAVSCNTHDVTVFAFGLTDDSVLYNDPQKEWQYPGRGRDDSIGFRSHLTNVPNISFFNSDLDKEGRYLVSTDLNGVIVLWDLRERCQLKRIEPSPPAGHLHPRSGWSVACVDPRAFLIVTWDLDFLGCKLEQNENGTYDITQGRSMLKDSSIQYPEVIPSPVSFTDLDSIRQHVAITRRDLLAILETQQQFERNQQQLEENQREFERIQADIEAHIRRNDVAVERAAGEGFVVTGQFRGRGAARVRRPSDPDILEQAPTINDSNEDNENENEDADDEHDNGLEDMGLDDNDQMIDPVANPITGNVLEDPEAAPISNPAGTQFLETSATESLTHAMETESLETSPFPDTDTESSVSDIHTEEPTFLDRGPTPGDELNNSIGIDYPNSTDTINTSTQRPFDTAISMAGDPLSVPFLLIHTGQDFLSLRKAPFESLAIIARDPCHQHLPPNMGWLLHHDRLHLSQLIPELNVFVAATAAGRAAIYTLTRKITSTKLIMHDEYGMRLDFIVPFTSQEARKERPTTFLIGLAVAPIQGHHGGVASGQRWRLTLTYHDHTIMNYELWRDGTSCSITTFI